MPRLLVPRPGRTGDGPLLPDAELAGLVRDGLVVPVGPAWAGAAEIDDRPLRLRALAQLLPAGVVASATTAAWAWHVTGRWSWPAHACVDVRGRHGLRVAGVHVAEVVLPEGDVDRTGHALVTTRLRTALDLLRGETWTPWHRVLVERLVDDDDGGGSAAVRARLDEHGRLPHARRARARLDALAEPRPCGGPQGHHRLSPR